MKKSPSRVIKPIETKNRYSTLESEDSPTENGNTRINLPNAKVTARQNAINTATQNMQNFKEKTERDIPENRKLPVTIILGDYMVNDIKGWKISNRICNVAVKHLRGPKTKDMKSYVIPTVE